MLRSTTSQHLTAGLCAALTLGFCTLATAQSDFEFGGGEDPSQASIGITLGLDWLSAHAKSEVLDLDFRATDPQVHIFSSLGDNSFLDFDAGPLIFGALEGFGLLPDDYDAYFPVAENNKDWRMFRANLIQLRGVGADTQFAENLFYGGTAEITFGALQVNPANANVDFVEIGGAYGLFGVGPALRFAPVPGLSAWSALQVQGMLTNKNDSILGWGIALNNDLFISLYEDLIAFHAAAVYEYRDFNKGFSPGGASVFNVYTFRAGLLLTL